MTQGSPGGPLYGTVDAVQRLTPQLMRVVFGGEGLDAFEGVQETDAYGCPLFLPSGASYEPPFDYEWARKLPKDQRPVPRRYTMRAWDPQERLLTIDFVVHGDTGVAGRWAQHARSGDRLQLRDHPGGAYAPDPGADWHLLVGDESALPAIAASLERVPGGARTVVVALVEGPDGELDLDCSGELELTWLHRGERPGDEEVLARAVADLDFPAGRVHAFVHGEAAETRAVRRHLLADRGIEPDWLSCSPYWRRRYTDEAWREVKAAWNAEVEQDVPAPVTPTEGPR